VLRDGDAVFSKQGEGRFPDPGEVLARLSASGGSASPSGA
jgi:hypothetical protein